MSLVDDYLNQGVVTQDPDDADKVIYTVKLHIKKAAVNAGAFDLFAAAYNYPKKVRDAETGEEIDNPEPAYIFSEKQVRRFCTEVFEAELKKQLDAQAASQLEQAKQQLL